MSGRDQRALRDLCKRSSSESTAIGNANRETLARRLWKRNSKKEVPVCPVLPATTCGVRSFGVPSSRRRRFLRNGMRQSCASRSVGTRPVTTPYPSTSGNFMLDLGMGVRAKAGLDQYSATPHRGKGGVAIHLRQYQVATRESVAGGRRRESKPILLPPSPTFGMNAGLRNMGLELQAPFQDNIPSARSSRDVKRFPRREG
jgi:hypothetical protein